MSEPLLTDYQQYLLDRSGVGPEGVRLGTLLRETQSQLAALSAPQPHLVVVQLTPKGTSEAWALSDGARTLTGIELLALAPMAPGEGGSLTLSAFDSAGQALLAASVDASTLTSTYASQTLTATTTHLRLTDGVVRFQLESTDATATGGPVLARLSYAS